MNTSLPKTSRGLKLDLPDAEAAHRKAALYIHD